MANEALKELLKQLETLKVNDEKTYRKFLIIVSDRWYHEIYQVAKNTKF